MQRMRMEQFGTLFKFSMRKTISHGHSDKDIAS